MVRQIVEDFRRQRTLYEGFAKQLNSELEALLEDQGIKVSNISCRVKSEGSLEKKISAKPGKYKTLRDITDLVGLRVIPYYLNDVRRVGSLLRSRFVIDWGNSEDKGHRLRVEEFGYLSDHYIMSLPLSYGDVAMFRQYVGMKAEVQLRSVLQHAWAEIEHDDLGYKNPKAVPRDVRRGLARVAGLLEVADREFTQIKELAARLRDRTLPQVRAEGLAEGIPEFEIAVPANKVAFGDGDLVVYFNTNVTSAYGPEQNPYVIVEDSASANPVRGTPTSQNEILFVNALPKFVHEDDRYCRFRIGGLRVNANQLGLDHEKRAVVKCYLADKRGAKERNSPFAVEDIATSTLGLSVAYHISNPRSSSDDINRQVIDSEEAIPLSDLSNVLLLRMAEYFPGAFRDQLQETFDDRRSCSHGTRLIVQFSGVQRLQMLWVSARNVKSTLGPPLALRMTNSDCNGAGRFEQVKPYKNLKLDGAENLEFCQVSLSGGCGIAVWEVVDSPPFEEIRSVDLVVVPVAWGFPDIPMRPLDIGLTVSFAPLSTVGTTSDTAPTPRFVPRPGPFFPWNSNSHDLESPGSGDGT